MSATRSNVSSRVKSKSKNKEGRKKEEKQCVRDKRLLTKLMSTERNHVIGSLWTDLTIDDRSHVCINRI